MAKSHKRKTLTPLQKGLIVGAVLIVLQVVFIVAFSGRPADEARSAIEKTVGKNTTLDDRGKVQAKIQLALVTFKNEPGSGGKWPQTLGELVPKYFDSVPIDPANNKPFSYRVADNKTYVGEEGETLIAAKSGGGGEGLSTEKQDVLIASLQTKDSGEEYVYDPSGKRDPFRPFNLAPRHENSENLTPLERYDVGQLKLTAVLASDVDPSAMVENAAGRGFPVRKGTKIGTNRGEVVEILADKIIILETTTDFTGTSKTQTVEMRLRTQDQQQAQDAPAER